MRLRNPILPGFHPDPSICRVGEDFYLVNSSFEYFPGVPIFHSRDLVHWRPLGHVLTRPSQLGLQNAAPSDGIYAPTIRHHAGRFYVATTNHFTGLGFRNFFVTAEHPTGPWSEPIWVAQGGIDPSLCFDTDGRTYWTGNGTGWTQDRGLYQSEIDPATGRLLGPTRLLWRGSGGSYPEGPHLFRRGEYYYLLAAEGGTAECHMTTVARARQPFGPFESCPHNPILTHRSLMNPLTSTGHADFVEDAQGNWWAVFLAVRYAEHAYSPLGRETCLAPVTWTDDGWPLVHQGQRIPLELDVPGLPEHRWPEEPTRDHFAPPTLRPCWVQLRAPTPAALHLLAAGGLRLTCSAPTLDELAAPAAVFRRQQHFAFSVHTTVSFTALSESEEAGLTILLDHRHHAEIVVTQRAGRAVVLLRRRIGSLVGETQYHPLPAGPAPLQLSLRGDRRAYHFSVRAANGATIELGEHEVRYVSTSTAGGYTGAMLGLFATARGVASSNAAQFHWFDYLPDAV